MITYYNKKTNKLESIEYEAELLKYMSDNNLKIMDFEYAFDDGHKDVNTWN